MSLVAKKSSKLKVILIIFIVILIILAFIMYFLYFALPDKEPKEEESLVGAGKTGLEIFLDLEKKQEYIDLKKYGNWPLPFEPKGRPSPFIRAGIE